jgi:hypothetical protein
LRSTRFRKTLNTHITSGTPSRSSSDRAMKMIMSVGILRAGDDFPV